MHREGITEVTAADIASARALGRVVKLLAICERCGGGVSVRVHPAMIPRSHPLAAVAEAYNAVFVEAASAGQLMFYGAGRGRHADRQRGARRPRGRRPEPAGGHPRAGCSTYAELPVMPDGGDAHPLPRLARR